MRRAAFTVESRTHCIVDAAVVADQKRTWVRPKKRPKVTPSFHDKAQKWREEWLHDRQRQVADGLRQYVHFSTTKRLPPWDARFAPFDRSEKDGVHVVMKHLMEDKLSIANYHQRATKRLFCNVGLIGPVVTTKARWRSQLLATFPAHSTKQPTMVDKGNLAKPFCDPKQE